MHTLNHAEKFKWVMPAQLATIKNRFFRGVTTLQAEYNRLTKGAMVTVATVPAVETKTAATTGGRQARITTLLDQLKANNQAELVNAANIYATATMAVRMLG